jgi:cysteine-rich repeat protein
MQPDPVTFASSFKAVKTPVCGNGIIESAEVCDDGNDDDGDSCPNSCKCGGEELGTLTVTQNGNSFEVKPFSSDLTAEEMYGYDTEFLTSSRLTGVANFLQSESSMLFGYYDRERGNMSVGAIHDKPNDGTPGSINWDIFGNRGYVEVEDDDFDNEFVNDNRVEWWWGGCCTDGLMYRFVPNGVCARLEIEPEFLYGINRWWFLEPNNACNIESSDYESTPLDMSSNVTIEYCP